MKSAETENLFTRCLDFVRQFNWEHDTDLSSFQIKFADLSSASFS